MNKYIDLHMHSSYSDDGEISPKDLVRQCYECGVSIMAIADHNSVKAIAEAIPAANALGIHCIPGIEIDCRFKGVNLHLLGYGIDYTLPEFSSLEEDILSQEKACSDQKIQLTNQLGFQITRKDLDPLSPSGIYTGELFAEVLLNDARYQHSELLLPYRLGGSRSDNPYVNFYWDFYSQGKPCYTKIDYPSLEAAISLIRSHGGVAVLAHPGNNLKDNFKLFDDMLPLGLQGVEAFSNYHDPDTVAYFLNAGRAAGLLITCGSDYHGKTKPAIKLGETRCTIDEGEIEQQLKDFGLLPA